jgi:hypothetical protein
MGESYYAMVTGLADEIAAKQDKLTVGTVNGGFSLLDPHTNVVRAIQGVSPVNVAIDTNHVAVYLDPNALGAQSATGPAGTFSMVDAQGKILRLRPGTGAYAVTQSGQGSVELGVQLQAAQFQAPFSVMDQATATALRARFLETKAEFFTAVEVNGATNVSGTLTAGNLRSNDTLEVGVYPPAAETVAVDGTIGATGNISTAAALRANSLAPVSGTVVTATQDLAVAGNLTLSGSLVGWTPYYCAGRVNGVNVTVGSSIGRVGYTVARASGQATGVFVITFASPAPNNNYVITMLPMTFGTSYLWDVNPPTVNGFHCVVVSNTWQLKNATFHFSVTL